ncbi:MAG: response regulator [Chloroflexi bacterium]|nr:response regulator [Chloroflexota bacterium]
MAETGSLAAIDHAAFDELVHEALAHLYDLAFLQRSPLVDMLGLRRDGGGGTALHRLLVEAIEQLKPPREVAPDALAWKTYRSLFLRYVRALNAGAAARELGLSPRQEQRIHTIALGAISALLRESRPIGQTDPLTSAAHVTSSDDERVLDDEIATILASERGEVESFAAIVQGAVATINPVLAQRQIEAEIQIDPALADGTAPHDLLRQAVVQLCLAVAEGGGPARLLVRGIPSPPAARLTLALDRDPPALPPPARSMIARRLRIAERLLGALGGRCQLLAGRPAAVEAYLPLGVPPVVLAVEDNPQVVQLFQRYLSGTVYRLIHAADADTALTIAERQKPDAITLDVMMPRRDGWELLQALKVRPETRQIPVIVCSVLRDRDLALALGAVDFLPKPISQQALLGALGRHVPAARTLSDLPADGPQAC